MLLVFNVIHVEYEILQVQDVDRPWLIHASAGSNELQNTAFIPYENLH